MFNYKTITLVAVIGILCAILFCPISSAMKFEQPVKIGSLGYGVQSPYGGGFYIEGASSNNGNHYTKYSNNSTHYDTGLACFGTGEDALYFHYSYDKYTKFGGKNISDTIDIEVGAEGSILQIKSSQNITFYSIRFGYQSSDLTIIGRNPNGKWIKYINTKDITNKYFGGQEGYKFNGGVIYKQVSCKNDTIIIPYLRWTWKTYEDGPLEGEIRLKWNDSAQWFGIEKVVY